MATDFPWFFALTSKNNFLLVLLNFQMQLFSMFPHRLTCFQFKLMKSTLIFKSPLSSFGIHCARFIALDEPIITSHRPCDSESSELFWADFSLGNIRFPTEGGKNNKNNEPAIVWEREFGRAPQVARQVQYNVQY